MWLTKEKPNNKNFSNQISNNLDYFTFIWFSALFGLNSSTWFSALMTLYYCSCMVPCFTSIISSGSMLWCFFSLHQRPFFFFWMKTARILSTVYSSFEIPSVIAIHTKQNILIIFFIWFPVNINLNPITWFSAIIIIIVAFTSFPAILTFLLRFPALKYNFTRFKIFWMFSLHRCPVSSFLANSFQIPRHLSSALVNLSLMVLQGLEDEQSPSSSPRLTQQTPEIKAPHFPLCMTTWWITWQVEDRF